MPIYTLCAPVKHLQMEISYIFQGMLNQQKYKKFSTSYKFQHNSKNLTIKYYFSMQQFKKLLNYSRLIFQHILYMITTPLSRRDKVYYAETTYYTFNHHNQSHSLFLSKHTDSGGGSRIKALCLLHIVIMIRGSLILH